ncbi:MAG: hypothetical protein IPN72_24700 [Saprospiraceae bacterium]|nr:hypothetical protein [Saprospiraceae bacterium]
MFIVPVVNPDGYEYNRQTNPQWRYVAQKQTY